ncbi:MAG: hypothetical protein RRA92_11445 [Gemmatimonadota bacterium]|nr:hypothetical protein [Gemmatimonadota bacterium]
MRKTATVDLDFSFRPETYWETEDPVDAIVGTISGEARRRLVREAFESGDAGPLADLLLEDRLGALERAAWGAIHPLLMGGEYLPDDLPGEAEIVRVSLDSTTGDVMELRARPIPGGIAYRIVDEYETRFPLPFYESPWPLTTAGVVRLLDETHGMCAHTGPGLVWGPLVMNFGGGPGPKEDVEKWRRRASRFVRVRSRFYPGLGEWYASRIEAWLDTLLAEHGFETGEGDDASAGA